MPSGGERRAINGWQHRSDSCATHRTETAMALRPRPATPLPLIDTLTNQSHREQGPTSRPGGSASTFLEHVGRPVNRTPELHSRLTSVAGRSCSTIHCEERGQPSKTFNEGGKVPAIFVVREHRPSEWVCDGVVLIGNAAPPHRDGNGATSPIGDAIAHWLPLWSTGAGRNRAQRPTSG